jgi:hypothetical protein
MENSETESKNKTLTENVLKINVTEARERRELSVKHIMARKGNILKAKLGIGNLYSLYEGESKIIHNVGTCCSVGYTAVGA